MTALLLFITVALGSNGYEATFVDAGEAYAADDYTTAARLYEQLVEEGVVNSALFYNLGNTYYRMKQLGPAIANYERALQLEPQLDAARENLDMAIRATERHLARPLPSEWEQSLLFWHYNLSQHTTSLLAGLFWCVFWLAMGIRIWRRFPFFKTTAIALFLLALAFGSSAWAKAHPVRIAVASCERVPVRYGMSDDDTVRFDLRVGDRVVVEKRQNGWTRVVTSDGERGWTHDECLTFVGPPYEPALQVKQEQSAVLDVSNSANLLLSPEETS